MTIPIFPRWRCPGPRLRRQWWILTSKGAIATLSPHGFFGGAVGDPEEAARAANEAALRRERYFRDLLEERRRQPGDDLISLLVRG